MEDEDLPQDETVTEEESEQQASSQPMVYQHTYVLQLKLLPIHHMHVTHVPTSPISMPSPHMF
jgi:hypothetical protein